jgi:hypothetical protein
MHWSRASRAALPSCKHGTVAPSGIRNS